jgi:multicomponent Na+:H+ antiporter subunit D
VSQVPVLIPALLLLAALLSLLGGLRSVRLGYAITVVAAAGAFVLSALGLVHVSGDGETLRYALGAWVPPVGIEFVLDPLAGFMTTLITFMGLVAVVYAPRSLAFEAPGKRGYAYPAMLLLLAGLSGMSVTGDLFNLYVFLEIAALAAYALLAIGERGAPVATLRYLLIGAVGGGLYLVGVAFIYFSVGTLNMADIFARLPEVAESRAVVAAACFMVLGLGVKMALFPLHFWLPDVYTNGPSASVGLIAPIMTKVSAYAIIRLFLDVFPPEYFTETLPMASTIGWLSAGGILYGSILAMAQDDYRRMLAYSSVGQISYVGLGIGLANPLGLIGGILHILNHALMKGCLFLISGAVRLRTGRTRISSFGGLGRKMPWTMVAFVVAALAMVGIPPTAGFFSKWYLLLGAAEGGAWVWFGVIILSSLMTAVYFFRTVERIYRDPEGEEGSEREGQGDTGVQDPPASMLGPILILAVAILAAGLFNVVIVTQVLERVVAPLGG